MTLTCKCVFIPEPSKSLNALYCINLREKMRLLVERENKYGRYFLYSLCPAVKRKDLNSQLNISFRNSTILGHMMIRITIKTRMNHSLIPRRLEPSWE